MKHASNLDNIISSYRDREIQATAAWPQNSESTRVFELALRQSKNPDDVVTGKVNMVKQTKSFEIGTEEWLTQTGGRLSIAQALVLSGQGLAQAGRERFNRRRPTTAESSSQRARVDIARDELATVLKTQRARVIERQGQALLNHACRTYLLGAALVSDELFGRANQTATAVAALAHDDGLVHPTTGGNCFTADSATEAQFILNRVGSSRADVQVARSAVISHFQPRLPAHSGADAQIVALGASADVMGFGLGRVDPELLQDMWDEWPELGFLADVKLLLKRERTRAPRTRPGVLAISGMPYLLRPAR